MNQNNSPLKKSKIETIEIHKENDITYFGFSTLEDFLLILNEMTPEKIIVEYIESKNIAYLDAINLLKEKIRCSSILGFLNSNLDLEKNDQTYHSILIYILEKLRPPRHKLKMYNSFDDVINLIKKSKNILVLTGAGVSVSCGIPDFRSKNGIYTQLKQFDLEEPEQMFDIEYFKFAPELFYYFAKEIYPTNFKPSLSHYFIKLLEDNNKLLRNYTQNIDTLEQYAGIVKVLNCHGSFSTASCILCKEKFPGEYIKENIFTQTVAYCPKCIKKNSETEEVGVIKPDITFFGEQLSSVFDQKLNEDIKVVDLLIVMGTSLEVQPVSSIIKYIPVETPQILINKTPNYKLNFDIQLIGESDYIVQQIVKDLGWIFSDDIKLNDLKDPQCEAHLEIPDHWHLFHGADLGISGNSSNQSDLENETEDN